MDVRTALVAALAAAGLAACDGGGDGSFTPPATPAPSADPAPPALGLQVDRMGRSAVSSGLVSPIADDTTRASDLDAYNAAVRADWGDFSTIIRTSLAVFDGLDAMCGNQILADLGATGPERYDALTGALVDDRLFVDAASGACTQYLAVELDATGLLANGDCGGRTPLYDTIDVTFTALSNDLTVPVGDGIPMDDGNHSVNLFPYLTEAPPPPDPPVLGTQVDRMGRSAVSSGLVSPIADEMTRGMDIDAYNAAEQADWGDFSGIIRTSLAVFDSLDTVCGNQILADASLATPARYDALTGALTDDRLYVNSASGTCAQYLAVELDATGLAANDDCGGRTPRHDTIDVTYTALSNDLTVAVGDGVDADNAVHFTSGFPFLAAP